MSEFAKIIPFFRIFSFNSYENFVCNNILFMYIHKSIPIYNSLIGNFLIIESLTTS